MLTDELATNPNPTKTVNIAVPPYEINGSGAPTTGKIPVTIATFTKTYKKIITDIPKHKRVANLLLLLIEIKFIDKRITK